MLDNKLSQQRYFRNHVEFRHEILLHNNFDAKFVKQELFSKLGMKSGLEIISARGSNKMFFYLKCEWKWSVFLNVLRRKYEFLSNFQQIYYFF